MMRLFVTLFTLLMLLTGCGDTTTELTIVVTSVTDGFSGTYKVDDKDTKTFSDTTLEDNIAIYEKDVDVEDRVKVFASPQTNATYISIDIYDGDELVAESTDEGDTVSSLELEYELTDDSSDE